MAITPLHFAFITKYVAHFVAQSLLFPAVAITQFWKSARLGPFSQVLSHMCIYSFARFLQGQILEFLVKWFDQANRLILYGILRMTAAQ